jgi:uncharacterized oxidoreductase
MELKNSTILITGGTSGIGLEFVKQLIPLGAAKIIVTGRDMAKLEQVKKQFPQVIAIESDVSDPEDIEQLYTQVVQQYPEMNILINNAGIMRNLDLQDTSMDLTNITREIDTNLSGTVRMVHQFLPHLKTKEKSAIINISSGLAFIPFPAAPVYSATKFGIHAYTQVLRLQLKSTNVKVFELAPPGTDTPLLDDFSGIMDSSRNMKVDKMVRIAIRGILKDKKEIKPGVAKVLKFMGRLAPDLFLNLLNKSIAKEKSPAQ